jgi:hypothetical protein
VLVTDRAVLIDEIGFGCAVNAIIDRDASIEVGRAQNIRVA